MPIKVTKKIKEIMAARDQKIYDAGAGMKHLLDEVKKQVLLELVKTPADSYSSYHLKQSLAAIEQYLGSFESSAKREIQPLLNDTWEMGTSLVSSASEAAGMKLGSFWIPTTTFDALKDYTFGKISGLTGDLVNKVRGEISLGILGQKTPLEVANAISGSLQSPSIFKTVAERAEVIAHLEMGRVFSVATEKSIEAARDVLPDLQSMWIHAGHPKMPRKVHLMMHGQVRKAGKPFYLTEQNVPVMYPRDPKAPIQEVIRCGCTHIPYHKDWGKADDFAKAWDQTQYKVNRMGTKKT